ncbi:SIS domain-containing protein [Ignisphaera sp. 4213-co]|uniref:SIS domain-containing protein n=1 Tax=Ignisphaera cupida TaxID=3050454 RepID=A0ABD4Z8Z1_9CREN|nr:SIS domain-containing protein [Ignisphaera sp. 4213-co]MDK6029370.1 SIS domain-containing protein [Ignisphaera sp. 4213-co]
MSSKSYNVFRDIVVKLIDRIVAEERNRIEEASELIVEALSKEGFVYVFGTGHSMITALEMFYRAGGLVRIYPILDPSLLMLNGALKSTMLERLPGYGEAILNSIPIKENSVIIIVSSSGKNAVPVEVAIKSREKGLKTICITSLEYSMRLSPSNPYGKRLFEVCDVSIDNKVPEGDAAYEVKGFAQKIAPVSTILNSFIVQLLVIRVVEKMIERGLDVEVWMSSNIPGGIEKNKEYLDRYIQIVKPL